MHAARSSALRLAGYATIVAGNAALTFAVGPILIRLIGLEGFGTWSLVEPFVLIAASLALFGIDHGIIKQISHDRVEARRALGSLATTGAVPIIAVAGLVGWLAGTLLGLEPLVPLLVLLIAFEAILSLVLFAARAADELWHFAIGQVGRGLLFLAGVLCLLWLHDGNLADLWYVVLIRLVVAAALLGLLFLLMRPQIAMDFGAYRDAAAYGGFVMLTGFCAQFAESGDRYLVGWLVGPGAVGAYVVYIKLAAFVGQGVSMPFMLWFPVERFRHLEDPDAGSAWFSTVAFVMLGAMCAVAGCVLIAGGTLVRLYAPSLEFDPILLMCLLAALIANGMIYPLNIGLLKPGETHWNVVPVAAAGIAAIVLGTVLIPVLGLLGAAIARLIGALVAMIVVDRLSQHRHSVPMNYSALALLALGSTAFAVVCTLGPAADASMPLRLAIFLSATSLLMLVLHAGLRELVLHHLAQSRSRKKARRL